MSQWYAKYSMSALRWLLPCRRLHSYGAAESYLH